MDGELDVLEMQPSISDDYVDYIVIVDNLGVKEMVFTPEKITWLWQEMSKYRTLFNDYTRGSHENYISLITLPDSYWMEVIDIQKRIPVGIMYLTDLSRVIDPQAHILFFDRQLSNKAPICREILRHVVAKFAFHRLTAVIPEIYHATIRLALRLGFKREGITRESQYIGGKWVNEVILGILADEV